MSTLHDLVGRLFSSDGFIPRRICGLWPDWLVWEHLAGNAMIWLAYVAMPVIIWRLGARRPDWTPFKGVASAFALFIGLCGIGHFLDMLAFFHPMYRLSGHVLVATGLVSCWTAWSLRRAWPALMAMRSPAELERAIVERTDELTRVLKDLELAELDRAYLSTIVEYSDDAIVGRDLEGVVTTWNRGAERLFGYMTAEVVGRPMTFLFPPDRIDEESAILERLRQGEKVDHFESVRLTKDGRSVDLSLTISPIRDRSGEVVGISNIARDITGRKQVEAQARLLNERLNGELNVELRQRIWLVDQANDAIMVRSRDGAISSWNQGAERLYGWTRGEAVGRISHELLKTRFPGSLSEIEGKLERLGSWDGELTHQRRDGVEVAVASRWVLDRDGSVDETVLEINSDITERIHAIQQLKDSDARTRAILDAAADAILTIDERGIIESLNPAAEHLFGYPNLELVGQNVKMLMPAHDHDENEGNLSKNETTGLRKMIGIGRDVEGRRKDGTTFSMQLAVSELMLGDRKMFTVIARDNTEREKVEAALRVALDTAMAASRAKSEFLANMSHEIRTPMNGVLGMTDLLLNTPLNDLQRSYAKTVHNSGEALLTVINDILDFSKIEAGKLTLELTDFNLRALMEELADLLEAGAIRKNLSINCLVDRRLPVWLLGDPVRIRQVLTNLAGNAVKFTNRGSVDLEAHFIADEGESVALRILVRDTGMGIPEDRQADIFESFTQIEGGSSRQHGGTGLGLTICQSLIALMGGRIGLESRLGEGSTFWFEVTLAKGHGEEDLSVAMISGLRVLVVDDEEADLETLRRVLLSWECRPEVATSGAQALSMLLEKQGEDTFELIVLDQEMPGMNGEQVARFIKAVPSYADVPIILIGEPNPAASEAVGDDFWAAFLAKPVRRSLFYNALCRTIGTAVIRHVPHPAGDEVVEKLTSPFRILLAEDNEVNREVAIGMVERLGCEVDAAWNGREAIETLDYDRHNLILMDVQMPEMDGFAATAAIREREKETGRHIPILALTAHAMEGDRERCLAAGMDGYVAKPIRPGPLRAALDVWSGRLKLTPSEAEPVLQDGPASTFADGLRVSCGNDPKLIRKVVGLMLKSVPVRLERLSKAINDGNGALISSEAHSLKGAFATIGAGALASACQGLLSLGKAGETAAIEKVHHIIVNQWNGLEKEASHYLEALQQ